MSKNNNLSYKLPIISSICMILIVITALIVNYFLWDSTGSLSDPTFFHLQFLIVSWGIVMPAIALELSILGAFTSKKSEYIPLLVGILLITIAVLISFVLGYQIINWSETLPSIPAESLGYNIALIVLNIVAIGVQILVIISGIKCIAYYSREKR